MKVKIEVEKPYRCLDCIFCRTTIRNNASDYEWCMWLDRYRPDQENIRCFTTKRRPDCPLDQSV